MGLWSSLSGSYTVEITSASPADMLTSLNDSGIDIFDIEYINDLQVRGCINTFDYKMLQQCLLRRGEELNIVARNGIYWTFVNLRRRPILIAGILLFILLVLYLPTCVLFVRVEGNQRVPTRLILEKADVCGIGFGASRREVRSEKMKNVLLSAIPDLQWAGVNTAGCVAVITVQERSVIDQSVPARGIGSVVALRDGIIKELTVFKGNPLCKVGEAVKEGQVLVSGYTDCGLLIRATDAQAEVIAQTIRNLDAVMPAAFTKRGPKVNVETRYSIRVGKNIIKFCKDSGISDITCVKMYEEQCLTLPGGFQLPVSFIKESLIYCQTEDVCEKESDSSVLLINQAEQYLQNQMTAGKILNSNTSIKLQDDVIQIHGRYSCLEMIGQVRNEEIVQIDGKRNGKNR